LSAGPSLVRPSRLGLPDLRPRARPLPLDLDACRALLAARPLARLGCYHPARARTYCLPLWFAVENNDLWFYHPGDGQMLAAALRAHPEGICAQVDDLDCSPDADPGQPWRSVLAEGAARVFTLGPEATLPPARQRAILRAIRERLAAFAIDSVFVPPDPDLLPPTGVLLRLRVRIMSGQATGTPL
ncbi:MAG TPA: pyridoxamine 5'-phosphate oxidase family protein, partial [Chloroflexia bacterium]|nr:pyridoxamine 5'-phosphate oxidase family protein [Chloroflexia bacterium]